MELPTPTNPVAETAQAAPEAPEVETSAVEQENPETGAETVSEPVDDFSEIDIEGEKYRVPKKISDKFMLQADYTRKTQGLAEERRALEAEREAIKQRDSVADQILDDRVAVRSLESQLKQYESINWQAYNMQNPQEAQAAWMQYQQLKDAHSSAREGLTQKERQLFEVREREAANQRQKAIEALSRPNAEFGWAGKFDADVASKITEFATKAGFTQAELQQVSDPRYIQMLNLAMFGKQVLDKQRAQSTAPKTEAAPVPTVTQAKTSTAKDPNKMSTSEWMKWRESDLRKKGLA